MNRLTVRMIVPCWVAAALLSLGADPPKPAEPAGPPHRVPYRVSETLHMIVRAKLRGKGPFNFIVDTGAPMMFVTTDVAKEAGGEIGRNGWATFEPMELEGGTKLDRVTARVEDIFQIRGMNSLDLAGVRIDGVLGYNVLARFRMEFDLSQTAMTWTPLDFEPPLPMMLGGGASTPKELEAAGGLMQMFGAFRGGPPPKPTPRGFIGIELAAGDGSDKQVEIKAVLADSPAATAGLRAGDVVVKFAGKPVSTIADLLKLAEAIGVEETVAIEVRRATEELTLTIKTGRGL
jgi:hypothetical protein